MASQCRSPSPPQAPLKVKVVGVFKSSSFQIAQSTAEVTERKPRVRAALPASPSRPRGGRLGGGAVPGWSGACRGMCSSRGGHSTEKGCL